MTGCVRQYWPVLLIVLAVVMAQGYSIAQSYAGRADVIDGLYTDCVAEARVRAAIAQDEQTTPSSRVRLLSLTRTDEQGRHELCRMRHPAPSFRPWK